MNRLRSKERASLDPQNHSTRLHVRFWREKRIFRRRARKASHRVPDEMRRTLTLWCMRPLMGTNAKRSDVRYLVAIREKRMWRGHRVLSMLRSCEAGRCKK